MTTLHVLLPPWAQAGKDPELQRWLTRGDRPAGARGARDDVLRELFHFGGDGIPVAALRHVCHADDAQTGVWLCADPAWVRSEATGARLMAHPLSDISTIEAESLAAALRPLFGDVGAPLAVDTPAEWCVHLLDAAPTARFTHPARALGADLLACLPEGPAGRTWRRLFNETQIILHAHPVNAARIAAGRHPVNALWFWGAGTLPASVETGLQVVASMDDAVRGLAKLGGATRIEPLPGALDTSGRAGATLLDLDIPGQPGDVAQWLPHFRRWLRARRFDALDLAFTSGERVRVRHAHRLRFWRRA